MSPRAAYGSNKARLVALPQGEAIIAQDRARAFTLYATGHRIGIRMSIRPTAQKLWEVLRLA